MPQLSLSGPNLRRYQVAGLAVGPSSAAEVDVINQAIGPLGPTGRALFRLIGDFKNNSGAGSQPTLRVYVGATKVIDTQAIAIPDSSFRRAVWVDGMFANYGANKNALGGIALIGAAVPPSGGFSGLNPAAVGGALASGPLTIDTSVAVAFRVTWQLQSSSPQIDLRIQAAVLEVLP